MRQTGFLALFLGLCHYAHIVTQQHSLVQPCAILDEKDSISSHFVVFTASLKSVRLGIGLAVVSFLRESSAQHPASRWDILNPFSETDNSSMSLYLITFMIQLIVGVSRVTGTLDPKAVKCGMIRATWSSL